MSGWFASPEATERFILGECRCPGQPHDEDFMDLRAELSGLDLATMEESGPVDRMKLLIVGWNLRDEKGEVAIDGEHLALLYLDIFERLNVWLKEHAKVSALPNESSAPSQNGSKVSASRTRTTRKSG